MTETEPDQVRNFDSNCKISPDSPRSGSEDSYVDRVFEVQDVRLDPASRRTWRGDREVRLSRKEFDLVHALIAKAGTVVSRDELMRDVWNATFWTSSKTIDVHLGWVRRKLGDDTRHPTLITTVRGQGLRFETEPAGRPIAEPTPPVQPSP